MKTKILTAALLTTCLVLIVHGQASKHAGATTSNTQSIEAGSWYRIGGGEVIPIESPMQSTTSTPKRVTIETTVDQLCCSDYQISQKFFLPLVEAFKNVFKGSPKQKIRVVIEVVE